MQWDVGGRLRRMRDGLGLTQAEVAAKTGDENTRPMDGSRISRYETLDPPLWWDRLCTILRAMDRTPADLFADLYESKSNDAGEDMFEVRYHPDIPLTPADSGTEGIPVYERKNSAMIKFLKMTPVDGRYMLARTVTEHMVPEYVPGDLLIIDKTLKPKDGRILAGYYKERPIMARMAKDGGRVILRPANHHFPAVEYNDDFDFHGIIIHAIRSLLDPYVSTNPELRVP